MFNTSHPVYLHHHHQFPDHHSQDEDQHSVVVVNEHTPPPKPPRGVLRTTAPMKPMRSALRIEPTHQDDKENVSMKFSATSKMDNMKSYFTRSIAVVRSSSEFSGAEAADILEAYILSHREDFQSNDVGRKNAILLLNVWMKENVFRCVSSNSRKFEDCERTFYVLCAENEQRLYIATSNSPSPSANSDEADGYSLNRSTRRSSSFKRIFSPIVRRNRSTSRGRNEKENTLLRSTLNLFISDKTEKKAQKALEQAVKEEEAEIYELALFNLLSIVDINFLEDIALPLDTDSKKNASFLSSIMEKMGLVGNEERPDSRLEDEMDILFETHPLIRPASQWFQMARLCAPMLYLEKTHGKSNPMQMYLWCKAALNAVSCRLEKMTHNGEQPLFPNEFGLILKCIAQQLINQLECGEKLSLALLYLWLMVPVPLRTTIDLILQWLDWTQRTEAVVDLRSPYYLGVKDSPTKENCKVIIEELRTFIFPKGCMTKPQQDIFVETLLELRSTGRLGEHPPILANALRDKSSKKGGCTTPVRYCRQENAQESLMDKELVRMMETMLDDKKTTLSEKKKRMGDFAKHYPHLFDRHFKHYVW